MKSNTIIFDLGGVLIDWNPRHLYRKIFSDEKEMEWFLENICTSEWNEELDAGRSYDEETKVLALKFPQYAVPIRAWYERWKETLGGPIPETVEILREIKSSDRHKLLALTNWSAETFPYALSHFDFLHWFDGIVVSGQEKTRKPFPEFYRILLDRYQVQPHEALFIDDNIRNVKAAEELKIPGLHFQSPRELRNQLIVQGVLKGRPS